MKIELELTGVAHGGYTVGRAAGKVVFVAGGLPGERVVAEVHQEGSRFNRARVLDVLQPAPGRVAASCPVAQLCGGCDWQHADAATQLQLKTAVVADQLRRLAGIEWTGKVEAVPGGLTGWRTRIRYASDGTRIGFRARRSHDLVALPPQGCELAAPAGPSPHQLRRFAASEHIQVTVADDSCTVLTPEHIMGPEVVRQEVLGHTFQVSAKGFWQIHPKAARVLTEAVLAGLRPQPGESALDLYCGVGLFAAALAAAGCRVVGLELNTEAVRHARRNVPDAKFFAAAAEKGSSALPQQADLVVLDPPRSGAGQQVVAAVASRQPRAVAYVACDPAALGRDLGYFSRLGYQPISIQAYDLFPLTHHVECVAILSTQ